MGMVQETFTQNEGQKEEVDEPAENKGEGTDTKGRERRKMGMMQGEDKKGVMMHLLVFW
jgi:hypothetical protein